MSRRPSPAWAACWTKIAPRAHRARPHAACPGLEQASTISSASAPVQPGGQGSWRRSEVLKLGDRPYDQALALAVSLFRTWLAVDIASRVTESYARSSRAAARREGNTSSLRNRTL